MTEAQIKKIVKTKLEGEGFLVWKPIKGFEEFYMISNTGVVKSLERNVYRKGYKEYIKKEGNLSLNKKTPKGYNQVCLKSETKTKPQYFYIHRLVASHFIGNIQGKQIDHIDRNKNNNNVLNLRVCDNSSNQANRTKSWGKSKYKGVTYCAGKWMAQIVKNNKYYYLGRFDNQEDAGLAYNASAKKLQGKFAYLNKII